MEEQLFRWKRSRQLTGVDRILSFFRERRAALGMPRHGIEFCKSVKQSGLRGPTSRRNPADDADQREQVNNAPWIGEGGASDAGLLSRWPGNRPVG